MEFNEMIYYFQFCASFKIRERYDIIVKYDTNTDFVQYRTQTNPKSTIRTYYSEYVRFVMELIDEEIMYRTPRSTTAKQWNDLCLFHLRAFPSTFDKELIHVSEITKKEANDILKSCLI